MLARLNESSLSNFMFEIFITYLLLGAFIAMILLVWFNTSAFVEYMSLFGLSSFFKIAEYKEATRDDPIQTYPEYIATNHSNFFVRMITCPKCICIQLSALINLPIFFVSSIIYLEWFAYIWLLFPVSAIVTAFFGLYLYSSLINMMKHE